MTAPRRRPTDAPGLLGAAAAAVLALTLNIQPNLDVGGLPIRLSLSDIAAVLLFPLAVVFALRQRGRLLRRSSFYWLLPAGAACLVMTYGLAAGLERSATPAGWALAKYAGWYALLYYALVGAVLAGADPEKVPAVFIRVFTLALALLTLAFIALSAVGILWPGIYTPRFSGLSANPNAFGFALICGVILTVLCGETIPAGRRWFAGGELLTGLLCAGALFTRSGAALAGLLLVAAMVLLWRRQPYALFRISLAALGFYALPDASNRTLAHFFPDLLKRIGGFDVGDKLMAIVGGKADGLSYLYQLSLGSRLEANAKAISLWLEHPVFGIGLGRFLQEARASDPSAAMQIHMTPLWLLTEFGMVGLAVFTCLFAGLGIFLYRGWKGFGPGNPRRAKLMLAGLTILAVWAVMSLAHELMYQRVGWFILGLCAGVAMAPRSKDTTQQDPLNRP